METRKKAKQILIQERKIVGYLSMQARKIAKKILIQKWKQTDSEQEVLIWTAQDERHKELQELHKKIVFYSVDGINTEKL